MAVNKIIYGNTVLADLTGDNVAASNVAQGVKFHLPSGAQAIGTMVSYTPWDESYHVEAIYPIPTVSGTYTFNKSPQDVVVDGFDPAGMEQTGTATATNAGTYTVGWRLKDKVNTKWADNTTEDKSSYWTINKLTNALSANPTSLSWGTGTGEKSITITNNGDGTLGTPSSSNPSQFAITSFENNVIKVNHSSATGASGNISISASETSNTVASSVSVSCSSSTPACVPSDTLVTLADGTKKPISEIKYTDKLLTYRLETGEFEAQEPCKIYNDGFATFNVLCLTFDNDNTVKIMTNHGFLNCTKRTFSNITLYNYEQFIGDEFMAEDGTRTKLVSAEIRQQDTEAWAILTKYSENFIAEGIVSMTGDRAEVFEIGEDMKYDAEKMNAEIEKYGLLKYEDYADKISEADFYETNCPYYGVPLGKGLIDDAFIEYMIPIVTTTHVVPKE